MLRARPTGRPRPLGRLVLSLAAALAVPGAARAQSFSNPGAINVPDGLAQTYPSTITVANLANVRKLTVTLTDVTHQRFSDLRVLLVGPLGHACQLISKCGPNAAGGPVTLTFDDAAPNVLPTNGPVTSGAYRPTDCYFGFFSFQAPAPAGPYASTLSVFNNTNPNGQWRLYVLDDTTGASGQIAGGWSLNIVPDALTSSVPITIPSSGPAIAYPSSIVATGLSGEISRVRVRVRGFSHERPQDVDMLLVGPNYQAAWLMSDVGGSTPVNNLDIVFDDDAATFLPVGTFAAGVYKPSNPDPSEILPLPAPQALSGTSLGAFRGKDPNGVWSLFIVDDQTGAVGSINGWDLLIDTRPRCVADANADSVVDLTDIFAFLTNWFNGCP